MVMLAAPAGIPAANADSKPTKSFAARGETRMILLLPTPNID
jgi:hypothetical protein